MSPIGGDAVKGCGTANGRVGELSPKFKAVPKLEALALKPEPTLAYQSRAGLIAARDEVVIAVAVDVAQADGCPTGA